VRLLLIALLLAGCASKQPEPLIRVEPDPCFDSSRADAWQRREVCIRR